MSSSVKKTQKQIRNSRVNAFVAVLSIMEEQARSKNFFQRFRIACDYLFRKNFRSFFEE